MGYGGLDYGSERDSVRCEPPGCRLRAEYRQYGDARIQVSKKLQRPGVSAPYVGGLHRAVVHLVRYLCARRPGKLLETGNPVDFALMGPGYFGLGEVEQRTFTRNGQFSISPDGILVSADGKAVQDASGGPIHLGNAPIELRQDGSILQDGQVVARIGVWEAAPSLRGVDSLVAPDDAANAFAVESPQLKQGYIEMSNVSLGDEMVSMMEALRWAETGQRLVNTYDDLLGRVFSTLGQST